MNQLSKASPWHPPWRAAGLLALALLATGSAWAREPLTLAQALQAAWTRSLESTEAQGRQRRAEADRQLAASWLAAPPSVAVSQREGRGAQSGQRETELGLAAPLWRPQQREANGQSAQAEAEWAAAAEQAARLRLAGQLRELAGRLQLLQAEAQQAASQQQLLDQVAADVERRVKAGDLAPADGLAARAEALAAAGQQRELAQSLAQARSAWLLLTGLQQVPEAESPAMVTPEPDRQPERHPDLQLAEAAVTRASLRLAQVRSQRSAPPELGVGVRQERPGQGQPGQNSVTLSLRIPLGSDTHSRPQLAAALAEQDLALSHKLRLQRQLQADAQLAREALAAAEAQAGAEQQRASLLRQRAQWLDQAFKAGETSLPELLRALAAAAQADASAARQQAAQALAVARLQQALGLIP
ncbi:TolC family protein [Pelomonas sp. V22]|uniref:TolC family protein n=1 Tax=Pelomonas sp. V22 TaxID=2822139 RepID=UPI0024A8D8C0|nr:TolC family protein [Pelomonas sp. V22]MDI4633413.1 TolC family protein [Pelomonas sp. V22]